MTRKLHTLSPWLVSLLTRYALCRYRTPLCVLYSPQMIAAACIILAQKLVEGAQSPSLDHRVAWPDPSSTLPTPPSHQPSSPDASRSVLDHLSFGAGEMALVAGKHAHHMFVRGRAHCAFMSSEALDILLEFYRAQDRPYLTVSEVCWFLLVAMTFRRPLSF